MLFEIEKSLSELIDGFVDLSFDLEIKVKGLAIDSRKVKPGFLFIAYPGTLQDGRNYIVDAIRQKAAAVLYEKSSSFDFEKSKSPVPVIPVSDLYAKVGEIASKFYDFPSKKMNVVGVTGTNGKSSCSLYLAQALEQNGVSCGVIGTLGVGFPSKLMQTETTTPDPITLQEQFHWFYTKGAKVVAMEVSSHGLEQKRVSGVDFDIAVFTNLTHDHLDYHGTMANYGAAKRSLFAFSSLKHAVINADDEFGSKLIAEFADSLQVVGYTQTGQVKSLPMVKATEHKLKPVGFSASITTPWGYGCLRSRLLGRFNLSNLLAVLAVLAILKVPFEKILASLGRLKPALGRMNTFGGNNKPLIVVDFSHTPDSLKQALLALREHCKGVLWCVFGCGGDRDREKRPKMGKVVERYSDRMIITDDNPRTESSTQVVQDILRGLVCPWAAEIEYDRQQAISYAINMARKGDIILVAGKGHENYQIIGAEKMPFSDIEVVKNELARIS